MKHASAVARGQRAKLAVGDDASFVGNRFIDPVSKPLGHLPEVLGACPGGWNEACAEAIVNGLASRHAERLASRHLSANDTGKNRFTGKPVGTSTAPRRRPRNSKQVRGCQWAGTRKSAQAGV
ncbi:MAG: hypothetical protein OXI87_07890 [Albidovulum sp.]|nr:hypothetical protein [Albidovulum sp.]MDE0304788.1 hypothetical protein [Albidovulum sp.]MDE0534573.1 hypothetical protein [Albidovulum sp.]